MNRILIRAAIVVVIALDIFWTVAPNLHMDLPRSPETIQAIQAYLANKSETKKADMLEHIKQDGLRHERNSEILFGLVLLADIAAIYFFWNPRVTQIQSKKLQVV